MRTNTTTTTNPANIAPTKTAAGRGKRAKDAEQTSSFDQVLNDRRTSAPKKSDATKRDESPTPVKKSNKTSAKSSAKKKAADETDPSATAVEQPKQTKPAKTEEVESTPSAPVEQDDIVTPVEVVEADEQSASDDATPLMIQQLVDTNAAVAMPIAAEVELPASDAADEVEISTDAIAAKPVLIPQQIEPADNIAAEADIDPEAAIAPIDFELPVTAAAIELAEDALVDSPELEFSPVSPEATTKQPAQTQAHVAAPIAHPIEANASSDGDDRPTDRDQQQSSSPPSVATNLVESGDVETTAFEFDADSPTTSKHADAMTTADANESSPAINIVKPELATPGPQTQTIAQAQPVQSAERLFAADNHANIVSHVRTNLLPNGGTMQITLNPPELGAIQVAVQMRDGVMNASFATTSDQATRLLSHSLGELRATLENSGVAVDRLHVEQSPKNHQSQNESSSDRQQQQGGQSGDTPGRREQERRELLQRMWRRLNEGSDPLDMVA